MHIVPDIEKNGYELTLLDVAIISITLYPICLALKILEYIKICLALDHDNQNTRRYFSKVAVIR
ncbi:MAG: hypothetical protein ACM3VV_08770 [Deltaproteobacteria bacterium]